MSRCSWLLVLLAVLLAPQSARAAAESVRRFALVIGNNRPESGVTGVLRYADDDAVATHLLLSDAGVQSLLYVTLDEATRSLHPDLSVAGGARLNDIERGFAALSARIREAASAGAQTELLVFYSGHGDVDGGEGYVVLEGRRLTRSLLFDLLKRSPATHNHVFVDACKSYFLVVDRGPGGRRVPYAGSLAQSVPAQLANTGFVLSTSSDRDSHEWERYRGGILSHELRSALRGAADVDLDGAVSYRELGAFLVTANRAIKNPRFKPDFMVRAPELDPARKILSYDASSRGLYFEPGDWGHFYVEDARGERLLDAHPAPGQALRLLSPTQRPLFVRQNDERAEYVVESSGSVAVAHLAKVTPAFGRRGALSLAFQWMFAAPFGRADVLAFGTNAPSSDREGDEPPPPRSEMGRGRRDVALIAGLTALTAGVSGLTLSAASLETSFRAAHDSQRDRATSNQRIRSLNYASVPCYGVALAAGLTWAWARWWPESRLTFGAGASSALGEGLLLDVSRHF